ncbi:MAG: glycosyltransferase family 2 protein [archaeon]|nr:glycosyltransferase family 2 protein [archaeon]
MYKNPLVSVIIPTYNEEEEIGHCLKSLNEQSFQNFEIIIIDDGSTDKTCEIVRKFKNVALLKGKHKGSGFSRNLGARQAKGKILIFIDADMTFDKDYIKNLIKPIFKDKNIIGTTHDYEIATNTNKTFSALWGKVRVNKENASKVVIFRAILKDNFLKMGGFDSKYGYADDQTFWLKYNIMPIVAPKTLCYHRNPDTIKSTYKQARWIGASWKERYLVFRIPILKYIAVICLFLILPISIILKAIKIKLNNNFKFIDILKFYSAKFYGYAMGIFRAVFEGKIWK